MKSLEDYKYSTKDRPDYLSYCKRHGYISPEEFVNLPLSTKNVYYNNEQIVKDIMNEFKPKSDEEFTKQCMKLSKGKLNLKELLNIYWRY